MDDKLRLVKIKLAKSAARYSIVELLNFFAEAGCRNWAFCFRYRLLANLVTKPMLTNGLAVIA
jgi:hypothetical protein